MGFIGSLCLLAAWQSSSPLPAVAYTSPPQRRSAAAAAVIASTGIWCSRSDAVVAEERMRRFSQAIAENGLEDWKVPDYEAMRDDMPRTNGFEKALKRRLGGELAGKAAVVDIGTGPFAILAVLAAKAGARKVYAIEINPEAARLAKDNVVKLGLQDTIEVIEGDSMKVQLPERVDLIVSELIGSIATQEGVAPIIRDAGQRFLKEGLLERRVGMIPQRCQTVVAPVSYKGRSFLERLVSPKLLGQPGVGSRGTPEPGTARPLRIPASKEDTLVFLSEPQLLEDFDYCSRDVGKRLGEDKTLDFPFKDGDYATELFNSLPRFPASMKNVRLSRHKLTLGDSRP
eukprot:TRINITY_DN16868_c0_g1_i1.p1 TRINITY_DN16868_c0_g1~~TRINITY_DN16868_c0_g1_i1.p1  ORF type:complete len:343 (+),score=69.81 TRINITY_DN16868_c0_g1_i1:221-1249(+)